MDKDQKAWLIRLLIAGCLTAVFFFIPLEGILKAILFLVPLLIAGYDVFLSAGKKLVSLEFLSEDFLMSAAAAGIFITGLIWTGEFAEAPIIMLVYQLGKLISGAFESSVENNEHSLLDDDGLSILHGALDRKSPIERKMKRFSKIFTPLFVTAALLVILIPPLFRMLYNLPPMADTFIYVAMTLLILSCISPVTKSIPFCFRNTLSSLFSKNLFLKDQNNIQSLSSTWIILFDSEENKEKAGDLKPLDVHRMEVLSGELEERKMTLEKTLRQRQRKTYLAYLSNSPEDKALIQRADTGIINGQEDISEMLSFSDVVIKNDEPKKLKDLISASKNCMSLVKGNISFSIIVKLALTALLFFGLLPISIAACADVAVTLLCLYNSKRAGIIKEAS